MNFLKVSTSWPNLRHNGHLLVQHMCVCMCVCVQGYAWLKVRSEGERERACVCVWEREREKWLPYFCFSSNPYFRFDFTWQIYRNVHSEHNSKGSKIEEGLQISNGSNLNKFMLHFTFVLILTAWNTFLQILTVHQELIIDMKSKNMLTVNKLICFFLEPWRVWRVGKLKMCFFSF